VVKKITIFNDHRSLCFVSFGLVALLLMGIIQSNTLSATTKTEETKKIPMYMISTRNLTNPDYEIVQKEQGYGNYSFLNVSQLLTQQPCQGEVAIFVHGWDTNMTKAKERLDRVKLSLEKNNYTDPLVGFSWPSDTAWFGAKFIAKENGPKLAKFILELQKNCPDTEIRIIAHSLGARVILSSLDSLHKDPTWNTNNFNITSVHLLGAAVDNEEVSKNPGDILIDQTNWGTAKSDYGQAIEEEVINFYNLFSPPDNLLEPNLKKPFESIYPSFEADLALGQSGYQKIPYSINASIPGNYDEINVEAKIPFNKDADGDGLCDIKKPFTGICTIMGVGDNHNGYMGFRNSTDNTKLDDAGAIDVVVDNWKNKTNK
jgi:Alpha/beta hydrolase of unknown function (DUF900)